MFAALAKKTLELYALPLRLTFRQTHKAAATLHRWGTDVGALRGEIELQANAALEQLRQQMGIDLASLSPQQRRHEAQRSLRDSETALSSALHHALRATLLLLGDEPTHPRGTKGSAHIIEGDYERVEPGSSRHA